MVGGVDIKINGLVDIVEGKRLNSRDVVGSGDAREWCTQTPEGLCVLPVRRSTAPGRT